MAGQITIKNLRNIEKLEFKIPDAGVWLLTSCNGGGKSSLLACLKRIGDRQAFPTHFPGSARSDRLDNFVGAKISYEINNIAVTYTYSGIRWVPIPKKNSEIFGRFGFSAVQYVGATADRISPRPGDFDPANVRPADRYVVDKANELFETERFSNLRSVNLTKGKWNRAFVMAHVDKPRTYHSENHFSMGELCVLNLLQFLSSCGNNSLLLIDELELAIHPRVQRNLLELLKAEAREKSITVIFSTHSVTLLKAVKKDNIILLASRDDGEVEVTYGCYPTLALGQMAHEEERSADTIFYVEDENAQGLVEPLIKLALNEKYDEEEVFPTVRVLPIGPFDSVIRFLNGNRTVLPDYIKQVGLLDEDVRTRTLRDWRRANNRQKLAEYEAVEDCVTILPFVPEILVCEKIHSSPDNFQRIFRRDLMSNRIGIGARQFNFVDDLDGVELAKRAKQAFRDLLSDLCEHSGKSKHEVRKHVFDAVAAQYFLDGIGDVRDTFFRHI